MLGMYVHTHWAYRHPYAARTWTPDDWRGYLEGLAQLGYDLVMIWPQLDCMPAEPNESDRAWLRTLGGAIDLAHERLGMTVAVVVCPNTIGNDKAAGCRFTERPYFVCERKIDPSDPGQMAAFLAARRDQLEPLARADALAIIDSDPGGCPGSTNEQFADLVAGQVNVFRSFSPSAEFVYWMLIGWEPYCRFWADRDRGARGGWQEPTAEDFVAVLRLMTERIAEPWSLLASTDQHNQAVDALGSV